MDEIKKTRKRANVTMRKPCVYCKKELAMNRTSQTCNRGCAAQLALQTKREKYNGKTYSKKYERLP